MENIKIKNGYSVELFNGTKGDIINIDKSTYQFELSGDCIIWFHLRDIKMVNGELVDNDKLVF